MDGATRACTAPRRPSFADPTEVVSKTRHTGYPGVVGLAGAPTSRRTTALLGALVAALAFAALAGASAIPTSPRHGAAVATSTPTFTWSVPEGETTTDVYVSSGRARTLPGAFRSVVDGQSFSNGELTWTPTRPLFAGGYWWLVKTHDAAAKELYSAPRAFTVRGSGRITQLRLTRYTDRHHLFISAKWRSNAKRPVLVLRVKRGARVLWTQRLPKTSIVPFAEEFGLTTWIRPTGIRGGTPLKLTAMLQAGSFKKTLTRPFRAP